jgi:hypothetical protein
MTKQNKISTKQIWGERRGEERRERRERGERREEREVFLSFFLNFSLSFSLSCFVCYDRLVGSWLYDLYISNSARGLKTSCSKIPFKLKTETNHSEVCPHFDLLFFFSLSSLFPHESISSGCVWLSPYGNTVGIEWTECGQYTYTHTYRWS